MFNFDDCIAFITSRSAKIFSQAMEQRLRPYGVTRSQLIAIYYIHANQGITQKALADKMSIREPTVVRLIQAMEQDGLLTRTGDAQDKRIKQLVLTEGGTRLYHQLLPVAEQFMNDTIAGISEEDLQTLKNTLDAMVANALKKGAGGSIRADQAE